MFSTPAQRRLAMLPAWLLGLMFRFGWWKYRKEQGHPISPLRAFFGKTPRFSSYEEHEEGCPDWAKRDYNTVKKVNDAKVI
jgi:hypothetical protein